MYIHWSHYYLPKVFGAFSFVFNLLFIWLIVSEKKATIGKYRFLLISFAIFDMTYSFVDIIVPIATCEFGAAFVVFIVDGPFYETGALGQLAISIRCGFIALSYGILVIHFSYRYVVLFNTRVIEQMFRPSGLLSIFLFFLCHGLAWGSVCHFILHGDKEVSDYIYEDFMNTYNVDSHNLSMLMALYFDASPEMTRRSWIGILILTAISIYAVSTYIILGWKIMQKLANNPGVSKKTHKLHHQLFKALTVQTLIPITISFAPCLLGWYSPVLGIDLGMWNNYLGVIAFSAFPVLDPLAIIFLIPNYRHKLISFASNAKIVSITLPRGNADSSRATTLH